MQSAASKQKLNDALQTEGIVLGANCRESSSSFEIRSRNDKNINEGRWSKYEHANFLLALKKYGRDWKRVASAVFSRTST